MPKQMDMNDSINAALKIMDELAHRIKLAVGGSQDFDPINAVNAPPGSMRSIFFTERELKIVYFSLTKSAEELCPIKVVYADEPISGG